MTSKTLFKGVLAGVAGGMAAAWAVNRFYDLARRNASSFWPYAVGAAAGAAYATMVQRRDVPMIARVPLGAAIWLGEPDKTAAPPKGGRNVSERARNTAFRLASKGLKKAAERALFG